MVHDAGTDARTVEAYKRLIDAGRLKTRLYVMLRGPLSSLQPAFDKGPIVNYGNHRLAVRAIRRGNVRAHKAFMVGTFLGLAGAGLGALAPGRLLYGFFFA